MAISEGQTERADSAPIMPIDGPDGGNQLMTEEEAAQYLGVHRTTLWKERKAGRITFARIAGKIRYRYVDIETYLNRNTFSATA